MRICVPTGTDEGIEAVVFGHFGSAPYFSVLDTETGEVEVLDNGDQHHEHGRCRPVQQLDTGRLDAVAVRGMGRNALARFSAAGIPVYLCRGENLQQVLDEARSGDLQVLDPSRACAGHGHGHGHDHHRRLDG
ncbi:MAG: NifB/NifX family molybdenum-iron cluster-binding protein [bacterium]